MFNTHCPWSQMTRPRNTLQGEQITPRGSQRSHRPEGAKQDREPHATHGQRFPPPSACLQTPCAGPGGGGCPSSSRRRRRAGGRTPCPHRRAAGGGRSSGPAPRPRPPVGQEKRREVRQSEVRRTGPEPPGGGRLLTLPCTTACSPWRITFPGADSTRPRSHISPSRTRPLSNPPPLPPPQLPNSDRAD